MDGPLSSLPSFPGYVPAFLNQPFPSLLCISKLSRILSNTGTPINVCRPATAVLKKLVEADPRSAPGPMTASSSRSQPAPPAGSVWRYGFDVVWREVSKAGGLLEVVVQRLSSAESGMVLSRLANLEADFRSKMGF